MKIKKIIDELKEIRQIATMETANFDEISSDNKITEEIKNKTSIWRRTWIIEPLDLIIKELEEGRKKK